MTKVKQGILAWLFLTVFCVGAVAQNYPLHYDVVDSDTTVLLHKLGLKNSFSNRSDALSYVAALPDLLRDKGYITASLDAAQLDSSQGRVVVYLGLPYSYTRIGTDSADEEILRAIRWPGGRMEPAVLSGWQKKILDWLQENGHPFASTRLAHVSLRGDSLEADLVIEKGPAYHIDSIRIYGEPGISSDFLQRYLGLPPRVPYSASRLASVNKKLSELAFLQVDRPPDLSLLGTGAVLNLYLSRKKSSQVNALIGFLPSTDIYLKRRMLLAVDATVQLKNALGQGETIGLLWQQLQKESPRLNLLYEQPYIFRSPFGLQFNFDMFRQDTSFVNIHLRLGTSWQLGGEQTASLFLLGRQTMISGMNTAVILQQRKLPQEIDLASMDLGAGYRFNNTDYRLNPRKGTDLEVTGSAGTKRWKKNNLVLELKDPGEPGFDFGSLYDTLKQNAYQVRVSGSISQYLPLGRATTFRLAARGGWFQSASYFRNEMFRIGGYRSLRGFNDESQFVNQYLVGTAEFRYIIGLNSAFFVFLDGGAGKHLLEVKKYHQYLGTGLGLSFETRAGIVQMAWAVGKRDDTELDLKQSKIHIGFAGYF